MEFQLLNLNPKGWKTGDCVVRALAGANNMSWESTYLTLCEIGAKKCRMPNEKHTYEQFLKDRGWTKYKMPRHNDGTRFTVKEFIEGLPPYHKSKPIVISVAKHLTYTKDGILYDLWNCGSKSVGNYWIKENQ